MLKFPLKNDYFLQIQGKTVQKHSLWFRCKENVFYAGFFAFCVDFVEYIPQILLKRKQNFIFSVGYD